MNAILLVATREFRQVIRTRSFRIMLFGLPLIMALATFGGRYFAGTPDSAYLIDDASGQYASAITARIDADANKNGEVPQFVAAHMPAALAADKSETAFAKILPSLQQAPLQTASGPRPLVMAVYIPADLGAPDAKIRVWTKGSSAAGPMAALRAALRQALQRQALLRQGLSPEQAQPILAMTVPIVLMDPKAQSGPSGAAIGAATSIVLVYLLLMAVIMNGSMMLQGVIEERSNKLLESILACIRPGQLMIGKLLGLAATGLSLIAVWVGIILVLGHSLPGPLADFLAPVIAGLRQPWMIAALLFYFLSGYLVVSLIFLSIGSISNSMQDAQGFLMPLIWALMIPIVLMLTAVVRDPGALFPRVMSWIPVYTPFAMLARLGHGVPIWEIAGTAALLILFLVVEFLVAARIFEANLLATAKPSWRALKAMVGGARAP